MGLLRLSLLLSSILTSETTRKLPPEAIDLIEKFAKPHSNLVIHASDQYIYMCNGDTAEYLYKLRFTVDNKVKFSPDTKKLLTISNQRHRCGSPHVKVWNVADGTLLWHLESNSDVFDASFSPASTRVLTMTYRSCTTKVWSLETRTLLWELDGTDSSFFNDGTRVLTVTVHELKIWGQGGVLLKLIPRQSPFMCLAWLSPDNTKVATSLLDVSYQMARHRFSPLRLWDVSEGTFVELEGHSDTVVSLAFSNTGAKLITVSLDGSTKIWSEDGTVLATLEHTDANYACFSPDGTKVITVQEREDCGIWSADSGICLHALRIPVIKAFFSQDSRKVITVLPRGSVDICNIETGTRLQTDFTPPPRLLGVDVEDADWVKASINKFHLKILLKQLKWHP